MSKGHVRTEAARGRVTAARVRGGRVLADITLLSGEARTRVEILQPYGMTAVPLPGAEVVVQEIGGRGHLVALLADAPALRVTDAGPGEIAIQDVRGQRVVFRADGLEVTGALQLKVVVADTVTVEAAEVVVKAPTIRLGSAGAARRVVLDGDPIVGNAVQASTTKVFGE